MYNCLIDQFITVEREGVRRESVSLPEVLALLTSDRVSSFPALRPHQRQAWHAFLVQLAALAMLEAGRSDLPKDASAWATLLRALTPDWPQDDPWSLVSLPDKPALLQAPIPGGDLSDFKKAIATPDALDMLITSKNHDLKAAVMANAQPEDWLFALVTLQTMEGFLGAGNYGISRMNGGFANRPALGMIPPGGLGARFQRDVSILVDQRDKVFEKAPPFPRQGGLGLVWLDSWSGIGQLALANLDPYYIEICRRVRLIHEVDGLSAIAAGSKKTRIAAAEMKGNTGDPWLPIGVAEAKALSITQRGFNYRLMSDLLFSGNYSKALLQEIHTNDPDLGLSVQACGVARGQGITEGYHQRMVKLEKQPISLLKRGKGNILAPIAEERVQQIGDMRGKVLRPALFVLLQDGTDDINYQSKTTVPQAEKWLKAFEHKVDQIFFERLWLEVAVDPEDRNDIRQKWVEELRDLALIQLKKAERAAPLATMRRYRAVTRARGMFYSQLSKQFPDLRREEKNDASA